MECTGFKPSNEAFNSYLKLKTETACALHAEVAD